MIQHLQTKYRVSHKNRMIEYNVNAVTATSMTWKNQIGNQLFEIQSIIPRHVLNNLVTVISRVWLCRFQSFALSSIGPYGTPCIWDTLYIRLGFSSQIVLKAYSSIFEINRTSVMMKPLQLRIHQVFLTGKILDAGIIGIMEFNIGSYLHKNRSSTC